MGKSCDNTNWKVRNSTWGRISVSPRSANHSFTPVQWALVTKFEGSLAMQTVLLNPFLNGGGFTIARASCKKLINIRSYLNKEKLLTEDPMEPVLLMLPSEYPMAKFSQLCEGTIRWRKYDRFNFSLQHNNSRSYKTHLCPYLDCKLLSKVRYSSSRSVASTSDRGWNSTGFTKTVPTFCVEDVVNHIKRKFSYDPSHDSWVCWGGVYGLVVIWVQARSLRVNW